MSIQSTDSTTTINITADYDVWAIKAGVNVAVAGQNGEAVRFNATYGSVNNAGTLQGGQVGVNFWIGSQHNHLVNQSSGLITGGVWGVTVNGTDAVIDNYGVISGQFTALSSAGQSLTLHNSGEMTGGLGGLSLKDTVAVIDNTGHIGGNATGIQVGGTHAYSVAVTNSGLISAGASGDALFHLAGSQSYLNVSNQGQLAGDLDLVNGVQGDKVVNTGSIAGSVKFGAGADLYDGRAGTLTGSLAGGDGNDTLLGGAGDDSLTGGLGRDRMDAGRGAGEDVFIFADAKESRANAPDLIRHFGAEDTIDLSLIDANGRVQGQQHLTWGGEVAAGATLANGVVGYYHEGAETYVVFDNTLDGAADFRLQLHGALTLTADQFVL